MTTQEIRTRKPTKKDAHGPDTVEDISGLNAQRIQLRRITLEINLMCLEEVEVVAKAEALVAEAEEALAEVSVEVEEITIITMAMVPQVEDANTQVKAAEVNKQQVALIKATITTINQIIISTINQTMLPMEIGVICIIRNR